MSNAERVIRFYAALLLALVPMGLVALLPQPVGPQIAGAAIVDSIMLLGFIAYRVLAGFQCR